MSDSPDDAPPGPPEDTQPVTLEEEMRRSYLDYAMSVIVARALPDARDGLKPVHRRILYGMQDAPVHRLQPVARVRQSPRHDHAHGVIEIRALHLVGEGYRPDIRGVRRLGRLVVFVVGQRA